MGGRKADGCKQCSCPAPKMAQPLRHFFFASACVCFNPHPPVGGGCNFNKRSPCTARSSVSILTRPLGRVQPWRSRPVRHTPFRSFVCFNPHPPVGAGATHIHSIPHPQAARTRVATCGNTVFSLTPCKGAIYRVRGAIIPNCDHARKVGERLSSMEWQRAFRDYSQRALHSSEARLLQRAN